MAKLGFTFEPGYHWAINDLHRGKHMRQPVIDRISERVATGLAGEQETALLKDLRAAKRGRQPYGSKHLWIDIGEDNNQMRGEGVSYDDRLSALGVRYRLAERHIKAAIAQYEAGMEETRRIDEENR